MVNLIVIAVGTEHQINLGYIARVSMNFGAKELRLVSPKCKIGMTAIKYAKHGSALLKKSKVYGSVDEATRDTFAIATTAISGKSGIGASNRLEIGRLARLVENGRHKNVAVVIGRESVGLSKEEIGACDACTTLELGSNYNTLNVSHALAIILYKLTEKNSDEVYEFPSKQFGNLMLLFRRSLDKPGIRNKDAVYNAFKHVLKRANPTKSELETLAIAFAKKSKKK